MRAPPVIAGVLAQFNELLDVQVPGFEIRTHRALALATLIHGNGGVVDHFEKWHHALRLAVGALDIGAECPHRCPVVAETAGEFRQHGVVLDRAINAAQVIGYGGEVAGRELRAQRARIEQRRRGAHIVERRQQLVKFYRARVLVGLFHGQAHGYAHKEDLRQLDAGVFAVNEVAVVQGLQPEIGKLQVALRQQRLAELCQVELLELG